MRSPSRLVVVSTAGVLFCSIMAGLSGVAAAHTEVRLDAAFASRYSPVSARSTAGPSAAAVSAARAQAAAQQPAVAASDRVTSMATFQHAAGFAGTEIGPGPHPRLLLWWKGALPPRIAALLSSLRRSVQVDVMAAPHSLSELTREERRIIGLPKQVLGATVTSVAALPDYSGVSVTTDRPLSTRSRSLVGSSMRLTFDVGPAPVPAVDRWTDDSPFIGGALITRPDGAGFDLCTTGFSLHNAAGNHMLTARHCGGSSTWNTGSEFLGGPVVRVGVADAGKTNVDAMVLSGESYFPLTYIGTFRSTGFQATSGAGNPALHAAVFTSGALSGAVGSPGVSQLNAFITLTGFGTIGPGFWTTDALGVASVGQGDSGGPVVQTDPAHTSEFLARGMIDAIDNTKEGPCQGFNPPGRQCSTRAFHVNIASILSAYGMTVNTSF